MKNNKPIDELYHIAIRFRKAIESYDQKEFPSYVAMRFGFPRGSCGEVSDLLGLYFLEQGYENVVYVCGKRGRATHAWIEVAGVAVDITADQFEGEISEQVIVARDSEWHKKEWRRYLVRDIIQFDVERNFVDVDKMIAYKMILDRM